jgi:hypothetical protein
MKVFDTHGSAQQLCAQKGDVNHHFATIPELHIVTKAPTARLARRSTKRAPSLVMVCLPFFATFSTIMVSSL